VNPLLTTSTLNWITTNTSTTYTTRPSCSLLHWLLTFSTYYNFGFIHIYSHAFILHVILPLSANLEVVDKFCYLGGMLSVDGDADAAVEARIRTGWNKFRQLVPLLTNRDISIRKGRLYSSCVRSSMLHGSETWPVRKENEVALQHAEIRMRRWMCNVKVKDRVPSKKLRERLGIDDIILILQQNRLRWYGHALRKEDTDWCTSWSGTLHLIFHTFLHPKRTWTEVVQKDCQARSLNRVDAMDRGRWKKLIKTGWWSGWWVGECFFWYRLMQVIPDKGP